MPLGRTLSTDFGGRESSNQSVVNAVPPSNETYESRAGCNRTLSHCTLGSTTCLRQPLHQDAGVSSTRSKERCCVKVMEDLLLLAVIATELWKSDAFRLSLNVLHWMSWTLMAIEREISKHKRPQRHSGSEQLRPMSRHPCWPNATRGTNTDEATGCWILLLSWVLMEGVQWGPQSARWHA